LFSPVSWQDVAQFGILHNLVPEGKVAGFLLRHHLTFELVCGADFSCDQRSEFRLGGKFCGNLDALCAGRSPEISVQIRRIMRRRFVLASHTVTRCVDNDETPLCLADLVGHQLRFYTHPLVETSRRLRSPLRRQTQGEHQVWTAGALAQTLLDSAELHRSLRKVCHKSRCEFAFSPSPPFLDPCFSLEFFPGALEQNNQWV